MNLMFIYNKKDIKKFLTCMVKSKILLGFKEFNNILFLILINIFEMDSVLYF